MRGYLKSRPGKGLFILILLAAVLLPFSAAFALTISAAGPDGEPIGGYRWLIEEDATYHVTPGQIDPATLAVRFHASYMPAVARGDETNSSGITLDPNKHYFVSILPKSGYSLGGAPVKPGQTAVTVTLNKEPIPTAQISVMVFEDNQPINNAADTPGEAGLEGFSILLFDAAGRYGQAGGQLSQDAFGNPLGTTYNPDGTVAAAGSGVIKTDSEGLALIKNLPPGKYGVQAVPPAGQNWIQTSTIEGTRTIDAWVKANEPQFFAEFGPPGYHAAIGFVRPFVDSLAMNGATTLTGQVVNLRISRPPDYTFYNGSPVEHTTAWIGLNDLAVGRGRGIYAQRANPDGTFSIPNVPPGNYQLVVWDEQLDFIIALLGVTVEPGGGVMALGDVPVFQWFSRLESRVFYDHNQNGFRDCVTAACNDPALDDTGIPEVPVNLRFRDGSIYQSFPTDTTGFVPFDEVFPFFNWLVAEVDYARLKATGATVIVDAGGPTMPDQGWAYPSWGKLNPQPQAEINPNTGNNLSRTETGPVLLEAIQGFLGQTSVIEWGKSAYGPAENGGISGIVHYATTRAENDPMYAVAELWEPGIPRVQVNLYADTNRDGKIDDRDTDGLVTLADVDNYPFGWAQGGPKGAEDIERSGSDGVFDLGDALDKTATDSWDDNVPTGCRGEVFYAHGQPTDCFDGLRNFNQVRPGVFDGGYAFMGIPSGTYIVEAVPPLSQFGAAYQTVREEDKNVDFGEEYVPGPLMLPPVCVNYDENDGAGHQVPAKLTLFPGVDAPFANSFRPVCDRKQITLSDGFNAAVDFFMFAEVPVAGHLVGFILDDTANEFDPASPQFGEKYAPSWLPVSIRDWTGREISRVYSDEWGTYNALVPSSYTANIASPSGYSPNMVTVCLNDPGPVPDPETPGAFITDPFFNRQYSQFCYTFQYMPGTTTYLDTPVVPVAAFAGPGQFPLDCEYPDGTPKIYSVSGPTGGPYVAAAGQQITIVSEGTVSVPNPLYDGLNAKTITRDYGFGAAPGTVRAGSTALQVVSWSAGAIVARVPSGAISGQLSVVRGDNGRSTITGVTLTVGPGSGSVVSVAPGGSIQQAVDIARPGDLVLVPPGNYPESVIMWKPIRLQGWGPGSTVINAVNKPAEKLTAWRQKAQSIVESGAVTLLPAQEAGFGGIEPGAFATEEAAGILVLAKDATPRRGGFGVSPNARIDGFTITGSDIGGGIAVNGYAHYLEISNNLIVNNQGFYGGGIRLGHPELVLETNQGLEYQEGFNDHIRIHNNHITQNSGLGGAGGGVSICNGSHFYEVSANYVCGNFTLGEGGGIGHIGLSDSGRIENNNILFNQSFNQGASVSGGGVLISGSPVLLGETLSPGSGSVSIVSNLIQGNLAGAGDGGGISASRVNGQDVQRYRNRPESWHSLDILNNMIENNVAGLAGGAVSMQDAARVNILHNTIVNNDSTATAGAAFAPGSPNQSTPQPAGIVSRAHSGALAAAFGNVARVQPYREYANPLLANNIIRHNRSFYFVVDDTVDPAAYILMPNVGAGGAPVYWDLWVLGTATQRYLNPQYSLLTDTAGYGPTNISADPLLAEEYLNGAKNQVVIPEITTAIQVMPAFDEGGNFIDVRFGPITPRGDYHLTAGSPAINAGSGALNAPFPRLSLDYDGQARPNGPAVDMGADERY